MLLRSKTLLLLICLVLILFKTAAGSIFIQSAIERAELAGSYSNTSISQQAHDGNSADAADDKEQVHTMYLMSHVTANISETRIAISPLRVAKHKFVLLNEALFTQNFPDSAFKPPKAKA